MKTISQYPMKKLHSNHQIKNQCPIIWPQRGADTPNLLLLIGERGCKRCNGHKVEDEYHFLMKCTKYEVQRKVLLLMITSECLPTLAHLHDEDTFIYMLSAGIEIGKHVAVFIYNLK